MIGQRTMVNSSTSSPPQTSFNSLSPAEQLARFSHESYERHASREFGYLPRLWEQLRSADQAIRIKVAEELLLRDFMADSISFFEDGF